MIGAGGTDEAIVQSQDEEVTSSPTITYWKPPTHCWQVQMGRFVEGLC